MIEKPQMLLLSFPTDLGWMGLALRNSCVQQLKFGYQTELQLLRSFSIEFDVIDTATDKVDRQVIKWQTALQRFAGGKNQDLSSININLNCYSPFQLKVLKNCRKIRWGQTLTYGQLAARVGSPNAARAVGTAMKKNHYPLIVPCHRVVASNGIGGYSANDGVKIKSKLLALEGVVI